MKRFFASRGAAFLAERVVSQGSGLALTAIVARAHPVEDAAAFVAAYAFASLFQPLFANACQPLAIRLLRGENGVAAFFALWGGLAFAALATVGAVALATGAVGVAAAMLLHAAVAPLSLATAPLIAEDRWRSAMAVILPATGLGAAMRLSFAANGDLVAAAAAFSVEPIVIGVACAVRMAIAGDARRARLHPDRAALRAILRGAPMLMAGMALATLFWRAPVLIAEARLGAAEVLAVAIAMQLAAGFMLAPNALVQSVVGMLASRTASVRAMALGAGAASSLGACLGAAAIAAAAGDALSTAIYGAAGAGAAPVLLALTPLVALGGVWRLLEVAAGVDGRESAMLALRLPPLIGLGAISSTSVDPTAIAVGASISLAASLLLGATFGAGFRGDLRHMAAGCLSASRSRAGFERAAGVFLKT